MQKKCIGCSCHDSCDLFKAIAESESRMETDKTSVPDRCVDGSFDSDF